MRIHRYTGWIHSDSADGCPKVKPPPFTYTVAFHSDIAFANSVYFAAVIDHEILSSGRE